jgi:hypothetical protein
LLPTIVLVSIDVAISKRALFKNEISVFTTLVKAKSANANGNKLLPNLKNIS